MAVLFTKFLRVISFFIAPAFIPHTKSTGKERVEDKRKQIEPSRLVLRRGELPGG
jgi:hypothetical protein